MLSFFAGASICLLISTAVEHFLAFIKYGAEPREVAEAYVGVIPIILISAAIMTLVFALGRRVFNAKLTCLYAIFAGIAAALFFSIPATEAQLATREPLIPDNTFAPLFVLVASFISPIFSKLLTRPTI